MPRSSMRPTARTWCSRVPPTGEANKISVAQAGGDGGLAALEYNPALLTHYTEGRPAQDSIVAVSGFARHSARRVS